MAEKFKFLYVGVKNPTNITISNILEVEFPCAVNFITPAHVPSVTKELNSYIADLVLVDLNAIPGKAPVYISDLNKQAEDSPILALNAHNSKWFIAPLLESGAQGVLTSNPKEKEVITAVSDLLNGNSYTPSS